MDTPTPAEGRTQAAAARPQPPEAAPAPPKPAAKEPVPASSRVPAIIVGVVAAAIATLSIWYLVRGEPLLVQGEVDATRLDIAARVDGRVGEIPVARGQDVAGGAVLVKIDNPETIAKHQQSLAAKVVAEAQLANINAGTRAEVIAARKAALERAQASVVLAQKTYDRTSQLADTAMRRRRASTRRPTLCTKASARSTRPSRPTSRRSTAIRARSARSRSRACRRRWPTSRPCNPSSTRW